MSSRSTSRHLTMRPKLILTSASLLHIERARSALIADGKVVLGGYLSPVHDKYGKQGLASFSSRLRMLELATANSPWLMVDAWEANQADASSTYTVVKHLSSVVPNATIVLVCGADLVHSMQDPSRWIPKNVHELLDCATLCVLYRQGSPPPPNTLSDRNGVARPLIHVDAPFLHGSSTDVRYVRFSWFVFHDGVLHLV